MDRPHRDLIVSPSAVNRATGQLDQINRARTASGYPPLTFDVTRQTRPDLNDPIMVWERANVRVYGVTQEDLDTLTLANVTTNPEQRVATDAVLAAANAITRQESNNQYVSRQDGGENSTPALVLQYVNDAPDGPLRRKYQPTIADLDKAQSVRNWARETRPTNDYVRAMRHALAEDQLGPREVGTAASALAGYNRAMAELHERVEQRQREIVMGYLEGQTGGQGGPAAAGQGLGTSSPSRWLNKPGDKIMVTGHVERAYELLHHTHWHPHYLYLIRTPDGDMVKWIASDFDGMNVGDDVTLRGTVKDHITYHGEKQTEMFYCHPEVHPRRAP